MQYGRVTGTAGGGGTFTGNPGRRVAGGAWVEVGEGWEGWTLGLVKESLLLSVQLDASVCSLRHTDPVKGVASRDSFEYSPSVATQPGTRRAGEQLCTAEKRTGADPAVCRLADACSMYTCSSAAIARECFSRDHRSCSDLNMELSIGTQQQAKVNFELLYLSKA